MPRRTALRALALTLTVHSATALSAQTQLTGWNRAGQTWLTWTDNLTFAGVESVSIYRSASPITSHLDLPACERIGRLYPDDWRATRLQQSNPGATWTIPDGNGNPLALTASQGLFVYTPHASGTEYFAVVKTENTLTGPISATGPIAQTLTPVTPHLQHSGTNGGHPYAVYAFWIDGRADHTTGVPGFPVMGSASCHGVAYLFAVFEPQAGLPAAPMPGVVFLHGGGGSYWSYRPSRGPTVMLDLDVEDGLYVTPDENLYLNHQGTVAAAATRWLGTCQDYDRFTDVLTTPTNGSLVVDYSLRRIAWIMDWLQAARGVDPDRTALAGLSLGGRGTHMFVRAHPERVSAGLAFVMPTTFEGGEGPALMGTESQALPTSLPGNPTAAAVLLPFALLAAGDLPYVRYVDGTNDTVAPWTNKPIVHDTMNALRTGAAIYWDGRGHTHGSAAGWAGQFFTGSPKLTPAHLTRYRRDRSFPAFHDVDHDLATPGTQPDPGDPVVPANGNPYGTWGGWFEWDPATVVDTASLWSSELWLETASPWPADNAPSLTARASVTLRRLQAFGAAPHEVLWAQLARTTAPGTVYFTGAVQADAAGTITVPDLPFGPAHVVLTVQRAAAGGALVPYGVATPACASTPAMAGNMEPRIGALGFAIQHSGAPPSGFGLAAFGWAPANAPLLGITLHVELFAIPGVLVPAFSDAAGASATPLGIPADPSFVGLQWFVQTGWFDSCLPAGLAASRALVLTIQP